jgi:hypothetical protein
MRNAFMAGFLLTFSPFASADVLYRQPPFSAEVTGLTSAVGHQEAADDFTLFSPVQITGVTWTGFFYQHDTTDPHRISIRFFAQNGDTVANTPFYQTTLVPTRAFAFAGPYPDSPSASSFTAVIPPVVIAANQRTWLSLVDLDPTPTSAFAWQESALQRFAGDWSSRDTGPAPFSWVTSNGGNLAFTLIGQTIPEPSANLLLLALIPGTTLLLCFQPRTGKTR